MTVFSTKGAVFELKGMIEGIIKNECEFGFWFSDILTLTVFLLFPGVF